MANDPIKPEEMKKLVLMGKRRPMNFAFNPGPKDNDLLIIDKKKAPEVLGRTAKKEGEGTKVALGTFEIEGKKLSIKVPKELPGLSKKLRKYLKKLSFSFSVEVLDLNGTVLEADLSEEDGDATETPVVHAQDGVQPEQQKQSEPEVETENDSTKQSETVQAEDATNAKAEATDNSNDAKETDVTEAAAEPTAKAAQEKRGELSNRLRAMQAPVADLGSAGSPMKKAAAAVVALIKAGDLHKADATLSKIEAGLAKAQTRKASQPVEAVETQAEPEQTPKALIARAASLKKVISGLGGNDAAAVKKKLVQAFGDLKAKDWTAADRNLTAAENGLNALSKAPSQAGDGAANQPDANHAEQNVDDGAENAPASESKSQQKWEAMSDQLQAKVDAAMQAKKGDLDGITRAFNYAKAQASAGEYDSAIAAATNTVKLLKLAAAAPATQGGARAGEAADSIADNVVAYRASRIQWGKTRAGLQAELVKLKMAIDAQTEGVEGLEDVANNTDVLFEYVEEIDSSLETTLDALLQTSDGPEREKLKREAISIIGTYRATLDTDFFQAVDNNGFTNTAIRSTALTALAGVETALAA